MAVPEQAPVPNPALDEYIASHRMAHMPEGGGRGTGNGAATPPGDVIDARRAPFANDLYDSRERSAGAW